MKRNNCLILASCLIFTLISCSQKEISDKEVVSLISSSVENSPEIIKNITFITENAPARMSGSANNAAACDYYYKTLSAYSVDSVWRQSTSVPNWIPGQSTVFLNLPEKGRQLYTSIPLGTSAGTPKNITATVVEVRTPEELEKANVKKKIVFFNMVMDDTLNTYGRAGWQRKEGPNRASEKGALAAVVRSVTEVVDNNPHTGITRFKEGVKPIPAVAISTIAANSLSKSIRRSPTSKLTVYSTSKRLKDTVGNNIVAQIHGSVTPENIILISAHADSWFNSQGANDNAAGCVQAIEVLRVFKELEAQGIRPKNSIRILLYQDEEMFMSGFHEYAKVAAERGEKHLLNIELDSGAGAPGRFMCCTGKMFADSLNSSILPLLGEAFGLNPFVAAGSYKEWPLAAASDAPVIFYRADTEGYFHLHHSPLDNIDTINPGQLKKSAGAIASFVYLIDKQL